MRKKIIGTLIAIGFTMLSLCSLYVGNKISLQSNNNENLTFYVKRSGLQDDVNYIVGKLDNNGQLDKQQSGKLMNSLDGENSSNDLVKLSVLKDSYIIFESSLQSININDSSNDSTIFPVDEDYFTNTFNKNGYSIALENKDFLLGNNEEFRSFSQNYQTQIRNNRFGCGFDKSTQKYYTYVEAESFIQSKKTEINKNQYEYNYLNFVKTYIGSGNFINQLYNVNNI